jgi:GTP-binding protein LepA
VVYKIIAPDNKEFFVYSPSEWPDNTRIKEAQELWSNLQVLTPVAYLGQALELLESIESRQLKTNYLGTEKIELVYEVPLREIISKNFYDKLKSLSKGFASMNYEVLDWRKGNFVKLDILILGRKEEALSKIVSESDALKEGKKTVEKLKESLPSQLFSVPLQAAIGGKVVARETLKALRRDVIAPLYGGDYSRKRKLLEKQKKGKKKLKDRGKMHIPPQVFLEMFKG